MHAGKIDLPAIVLDRNEQPAAAALGGRPVEHRAPVTWRGRWNLEHCGCVAQVDADFRLLGPWQIELVQQCESQRAARRCVDDKVSRKLVASPVRFVVTNPRHRVPVGRFQELGDAATRFQRNIALPFNKAPRYKFQEWPRHAQIIEAKIAPWKRIEAWQFQQGLESRPAPERHPRAQVLFQTPGRIR